MARRERIGCLALQEFEYARRCRARAAADLEEVERLAGAEAAPVCHERVPCYRFGVRGLEYFDRSQPSTLRARILRGQRSAIVALADVTAEFQRLRETVHHGLGIVPRGLPIERTLQKIAEQHFVRSAVTDLPQAPQAAGSGGYALCTANAQGHSEFLSTVGIPTLAYRAACVQYGSTSGHPALYTYAFFLQQGLIYMMPSQHRWNRS